MMTTIIMTAIVMARKPTVTDKPSTTDVDASILKDYNNIDVHVYLVQHASCSVYL